MEIGRHIHGDHVDFLSISGWARSSAWTPLGSLFGFRVGVIISRTPDGWSMGRYVQDLYAAKLGPISNNNIAKLF